MEKPELTEWEYLFTTGGLDIYGHGCLRIGINTNTGEQVLGYVFNRQKEV